MLKKPSLLIVLSYCCFYMVQGQELRTLAKLPSIVKESSGIEVTGQNKIWTLNDSGGKAELYLCDTTGQLLRTLEIANAQNRDWEDMAQDNKGNFYIGDMGNNSNNRKDLTIYKISNPDKYKGESARAQVITFTFEDQHAFPPPKDQLNFDCESLIWKDGHLYLLTKHRTFPMRTNLYRIPDAPGTYVAKKISSFQTSGPEETDLYSYWIAGADISPDGQTVCMISSSKMWIFYDFEGDDFFGGQNLRIDFPSGSQKEAVVFINNTEAYITDEEWFGGIGRNLYEIKLPKLKPLSKDKP